VPDDANAAEIIAMFGGAAAIYASIPFSISASRALQRSIWWYNRDLP
jgi:hypothetical protein